MSGYQSASRIKRKSFSALWTLRCIDCFWVYNLLFDKSGVIYVVDELDYEQKKQYELTVRATDSVSGVYAEVLVSILVLDVNDCPPEFTQDSYNISVSEAAPFGTSVLRVSSRDNDTGKRLLNSAMHIAVHIIMRKKWNVLSSSICLCLNLKHRFA